MNPLYWAREMVSRHGWFHALRIATDCGKPMIGKDNDIKNPHAKYYEAAINWIKKNAPPGELDDK